MEPQWPWGVAGNSKAAATCCAEPLKPGFISPPPRRCAFEPAALTFRQKMLFALRRNQQAGSVHTFFEFPKQCVNVLSGKLWNDHATVVSP
jgi:hypothetical protein